MERVFIGIATHKKYWMPNLDGYHPIQVGADNAKTIAGYEQDNAAIPNISSKNANYSELTATYYLWKHVHADVKGIVHYRRYLGRKKLGFHFSQDQILNKNQILTYLTDADAILPKQRNYFIETNRSHYIHAHHEEPLDATLKIIEEFYPAYFTDAKQVLNSTKAHMFNMYIMKADYFDDFSEWLFDILSKLETTVDISDYSKQEARVYGYISELLTDVWIRTNKLKVREVPCVYTEKEHIIRKMFLFLKRKMTGRGASHISSSVDK